MITQTGSIGYVSEVPVGTINGVNTSFVLTQTPKPNISLQLFTNGILLQQVGGVDYTLTVSNISLTFAPNIGDILLGIYRTSATFSPYTFADAIIPTGTVNGVNQTFTLPYNPNPPGSLELFYNGLLLATPADYSLSGNTIVYTFAPLSGAVIQAFFTY